MVLSFNGRINIAVNIVKDNYPEAKLFEVHGSASGGPTNDPKQIDQLELIFFKTETSHIRIQSTGYAEFEEPEVIDEMWCESAMFDFYPFYIT